MSDATQVELVVDAESVCPVAAASTERSVAESVTWSDRGGDAVVEEFAVDGQLDSGVDGAEAVFETGTRTRYRFERDADPETCPCEAVESLGVPVSDVRGRDGSLHVTFYVHDVSRVRDLIDTLRERFGRVQLARLCRPGQSGGEDPVRVDRGRLTDRQYEVLQTAYEMGYFERPKGANASEIAAALDISVATLVEHLSRAQTKVLDSLLTERQPA
jgi:predicted DNA binding protein